MALNNSPGISTFDVVPPYRPTTTDFNGAQKIDDATDPPDAATMPNAAEANTTAGLFASLGRVVSLTTLSLTVGTPYVIASLMCAVSAAVVGSFTVVKNGTGDVSITWPANFFGSAPTCSPEASLNHTAPGMITAYAITNGVRIVMFNSAGAAADMPFTVSVN
jgi:hypothetical protein